MRIKTVLNQCLDFKCFCIADAIFDEQKRAITVKIHQRTNSKPRCSCCQTPSPCYDTLPERLFEFIPIWGFFVFFSYAMCRVTCPDCKRVVVEKVPWSDSKNHLTIYYAKYLAGWAKEIAWQLVSERFHTSWQTVGAAVQWVVSYAASCQRFRPLSHHAKVQQGNRQGKSGRSETFAGGRGGSRAGQIPLVLPQSRRDDMIIAR